LCSPIDIDQCCFRDVNCLHHQGNHPATFYNTTIFRSAYITEVAEYSVYCDEKSDPESTGIYWIVERLASVKKTSFFCRTRCRSKGRINDTQCDSNSFHSTRCKLS
jgi:hypothetical protein